MKKNFLLLAVGLLLLAGCKEQEQKERDDTFVVTFINEYKEMPSSEVSKKYWELRRNFSELEKRRFVHYLASEQWQSIIEQCVLILNQKFLELYDKDKGEGAKWLFDKYILHSLYEEYQKYVPLDSYYLYGRKDTKHQLVAYRDAFRYGFCVI